METKLTEPTTDDLKRGLVTRVALVISGCVLASVLALILPAMFLMVARSEVSIGPGPAPAPQGVPFTAFVPLGIMLSLLGLIAYGIIDAIRVFMRYRKSQQDDQMFP